MHWGFAMDRDEAFNVVREVRATMTALRANGPEKAPGAATRRGYTAEWKRLAGKADGDPLKAVEIAMQTTRSVSTWYRRRASIRAIALHMLDKHLTEQDRLQRALGKGDAGSPQYRDWIASVKAAQSWAGVVNALPSNCPIPKDERRRRKGKRDSLRGLPETWRTDLARRFSARYELPYLVAVCTGCRPEELAKGVRVEPLPDGTVRFTVKGAKCRDDAVTVNGKRRGIQVGQPHRTTVVALEGDLAALILPHLQNGPMDVSVRSGRAFSIAVRDAGRREWPGHHCDLSAYTIRHQYAADRKAFDDAPVAECMGHTSDKTESYYGHSRYARGGGPKVLSVDVPRAVLPAKVVARKARPGL